MKQIKFESNNKQWFVVDEDDLPKIDQLLIAKDSKFIKISEITEEQASEVVDEPIRFFNPTNPYNVDDIVFKNYIGKEYFWSAIESLHSLLKSKGVDSTWINPVIFEVIK